MCWTIIYHYWILQELLASDAGECEQDLWQREATGHPVDPSDLPHISVTTRASHAAGTGPTVTNSCNLTLPCKKVRHGVPDPVKKIRSKFVDSEHLEPVTLVNVVTPSEAADIRNEAVESVKTALNERYIDTSSLTRQLMFCQRYHFSTHPYGQKTQKIFCCGRPYMTCWTFSRTTASCRIWQWHWCPARV